MAAKKFIPAGAGMTKVEIFSMLEMAVECWNDEYDCGGFTGADGPIEINFKAKDISNDYAQCYVNDVEILRDEMIDSAEEDWVDERDKLGLELVERLNS